MSFDERVHRALKEYARYRNITLAQFIRISVSAELKRHKGPWREIAVELDRERFARMRAALRSDESTDSPATPRRA